MLRKRGQVATQGISFPYRNLRAQVATEFMLYISVFMVIAIVAFLIVNDIQKAEIPLQQNNAVKEAGNEFVNIITLSVKGGEGFSYRYTFPKTMFGIPYRIDMNNLVTYSQRPSITIEWAGSYGNFSYQYYVPAYKYMFGGCLGTGTNPVLQSDACENVLVLNNNGGYLTLTQVS